MSKFWPKPTNETVKANRAANLARKNPTPFLTLNEKISIKGLLARYGVDSDILRTLDVKEALHLWYACTGTNLQRYPVYFNFRKTQIVVQPN